MAEKTILTKNGKINDFAMIDALKGWNKTLSNIEHQQEKKDLGEVENKLETQSVGEHFVEQAKKDTDKEMGKSQAVFNYDRYDNWEDKTANDARQLLKMQWEKKDEYPVWANDDNELYVGKNAPEGYKPIAEVYTDAEELSNAEKKAREQFKQELITTAEAEAFLNTDADRSKMIELFNQNYNHRDYRSKLINLYHNRQNEIIQNSIQKEIEDIDKRIKEEDKKHPLQASQFSFVGAGKFGATPTIQFTEEQRNLNATADILKDIKKDVDARINKRGFFKGVGDELFTVDALDLGITSLLNNTQVATTLGQMEEKGFDNLREDEKVLLDALVAKEMVNLLPPSSLAYNVGKGVGFSIPFMIGYGLSKIPASALSKGAGKLISKYITKRVAEKGLGKAIAKASQAVATKAPRLTKLGNAIGQGTIQAGVQTVISPQTYSDMAERQIGEIETEQQITPEGVTAEFVGRNVDDKALSKALLSSFITNAVEGMGGKALGEVGGYVFNKVMPGVKNLFPKLKKAFVTHGINQLAKSTDFNGMLNEFGEEYIDQTLNALFVGDQTLEDVYSGENAIETALTTAAISFGLGLLGGGVGYAAQTHAKKKYNDAVKRLDTAMPNLQAKQELVNQIVTQDRKERKILFANLQNEIIRLRKEGKGQEAYALLEQANALSKFASAYDNLSIFNEYLNDQVQERMQTEREHIRQNANADMDNHTIIAQYEGENYLVVGGKVAFNQDGTIDLANSSESVTIKSPDDSKQIISPEKLSLVADMSFEELESQAQQMVWQRVENEMTEAELEVNKKEQAPSAQGADGMLRIPITFEQAVELNSQGYKTEANGQEVSVVVAPQQEATVRQAIAELGGEEVKTEDTTPKVETTTEAPVNETAVSKIPQDDKGNFLYEQADRETAFDAIVEQSNGDTEKAQRIADKMLSNKRNALKKAEKSKPRNGNTVLDLIAAEDEHQANIEKLKQEVAKWEEIASVNSKRNAEVKTEEVVPKVEVEQEPQPIGVGAFGNIYNQFIGKAKEAIRFLLGKKSGEAIGALHHKDIGDIDLVWGYEGTGKSDGFGLAKLAKYHPEVLDNLQEILDDMVVTNRTDNRVQLESNTHQASVRLTWDNESKNWLLTAFEKKNSAIGNTTDTAKTSNGGKQNDTATLQNTVSSTAKGTESVSNKQENKEENKLPIQKRQITYFAKEDKELGEYFNFRDFVLRKIATGQISFIWGNSKSGTKGLASHLGLASSNKERLKRIWMLDNTNGLYPEVAAEALLQEYAETFGEREGLPEEITGMTSIDAFNELIDVLHSYDTRNSMMKAAQEIHNSVEAEYIANLEAEGETETSSFDETDTPQGKGNPLGEERDEVPFRQGEQEQTSKAESQNKTPYILSEEYQKELKATATRRRKELKEVSKVFAEELKNNPDIVIVQSVDDLPKEATSTMTAEELRNAIAAKGWFVAKNGKAYILFENAKDKEDLYATLFHEAVAHKGIKKLLGTVNFNKLCQAVYDAMPEADRERIRAREEEARAKRDKNGNIIKKGSVSQALIADEYMAELAEDISKSKGKTTITEDIVQAIRTFLRKIGINLDLNQNDVRHILHASYSKLQGKDADIMNTALGKKIKQTAVREKVDDAVRNRLVYHGSGAEFERFDHNYMGTGEGLQAFGWGTYVTDVEEIGRTYAEDRVKNVDDEINRITSALKYHPLGAYYDSLEEAKQSLNSLIDNFKDDEYILNNGIKELSSLIKEWENLEKYKQNPPRHLYNVDIPDDNGTNYIHWETNTQELADKLNDAYRTMLIKEKGVKEKDINPDFAPFGKGVSGGTIYNLFARELRGDKQASQFLSSLGFVGISYPAQATTGGRADGARNFVIFNEDDAQIVEHTRFRLGDSRLRELEEGEVCNVERIFTENKNFDFTSGERIESFDDVAFIFKQLQDESVENSFAVLVKDGIPTVIHLGMGGYTSTIVNGSALSVAVERVQPDKIYFVHNHPSGALKASAPDLNMLYNLKKVYGDKVVQDGIIINLHSGKYGTFGNVNEEHKEKNIENAVPIKVFSFTKQVFKEDYNPSELFSAMSAENVASFISSQRLGKRNKLGVLVCNNQLGIVGNIFTKYTEVTNENAKEVAKDIVYYTTSMGGNRAIMFGDGFFKDITNKRLSDYVRESSLSHIELLDYVNVNDSGYLSANEEGVRFRFIGEQGAMNLDKAEEATIRLDNLNVARQMEEEGKDAKTIKLATGWERGADNKWRYEVEDFKLRKTPLYKDKDNQIVTKLPYLIIDDELFKAYPQLNDLNVVSLPKEKFGGHLIYDSIYPHIGLGYRLFSPYSKKLSKLWERLLDDNTPNSEEEELLDDIQTETKRIEEKPEYYVGVTHEFKTVLAHEIQHAIQYIEGFAQGGNEETANALRDKARAWSWRNALMETAKEYPELAGRKDLEQKLIEEYKNESLEEYIPSEEQRIKGFNLYVRGYDNEGYEEAYKQWSKVRDDNYSTYRNLSGEVESRNVQSRMDMTPEERRNSLASETEDVSRIDQIFIYDGLERANEDGVRFSLGDKKTTPETVSVQDEHQQTVISSADGVKIIENLDNAIDTYIKQFSGAKDLDIVVFNTTEDLYNFALENGYDDEGARKVVKEYTTNKNAGGYVPGTNMVLLFGFKDNNTYSTLLHEHIHYAIENMGGIDKFLTLSQELANFDEVIVKFVNRNYKKDIDEEIITFSMEIAYIVNAIENLRNKLSADAQLQLNEILNKTGYNKDINYGKEIEQFTTEANRRVYEDYSEHGRKQYNLASTHLRDNIQRRGQGILEQDAHQEAGVNFRLSEETDNILSRIEQRNAEAYNSIMNVELPKAETPIEIARNKQAERTLFRFDKDFASMQALQEAMRKTELWKYNQEGKAGELNRGLYDSMVQLANLIKTIEKAYGIKIDDDSNAYWLENSSSSKAQERTEQLSQTLVRSLSLAMHEAEKKLGSQELLKHYALAKAGLERQAIKEAEARAIAQEKGEEYEDKDYAGLTGLLADMMGYTEKQYEELAKKPMQEVFAIAKQNEIEIDKFIADCEAKLGNTASKLWAIVTELSDNQLKGQLEAGLISANTFNLLMYSGDANTLIEENVKNGLISKGQAKYIKTQGFTLEQLRDKGYITDEQYKTFVKGKKRYQYYLPLKGDSSLQAEDVIKYEHTRGKNQSKMKEAKGHRYKSTDPFVQLVSDCYGAIANEELNRWKRAIYEMCEKYPTDEFILDGQLMVQQLDGTLRPATDYEIQNGQFKVVKNRQKADIAQTPLQSKEHIMYVYINGEYRTIYFKNKQLAESINTQGGKFGKMQWLLEKTADFQRWWSKNLTTRNPAFIGANTARDFEEAMFVNFVNLGAKAIPVFAKAWNPASKLQRALHRHLKGKGGNTPEDQLVQEYFANGGVTAYNMIADNVKIKNDLQAMINDANRGMLNPAKWWKATMSWLDRQSKHAELVSRIATYAMYRGTISDYSVGLNESVTRSIWESKEVTVNFDKRGEWSKYTNLTSLFFNAGRQSNRMHYELFKRHPYRYLAAKTMMIAVKAMLPSLSAWLTSLFFDDEDYEKLIEKYNKINRYTRYNNLVLLLGDNVIAIPIAPSFSTTSMIAELARGLSAQNMEWDKWIPDAINAALSTYTTSAIGNIGSSLYEGDIQGAMLSAIPVAAIEPALQLMTNRDYQGRAIMKDSNWVEGLPNYMRAYGNTNPYLLEFSRWLNNTLGGKDNKPGALNSLNNPAGIQHLFTSYGGGALTFYTDLASLAMMLTTREDATASDYLRQAPIINRFFKGNIDRYMEQDAMESYYTAKENLQILSNRRRELPEWERAEYDMVVKPLADRFKQYEGQANAAKTIRDTEIENLGENKTLAKEKQIKDNYRKEFVSIMQDFDELEKEIDEATKKY